MASIVIKTFLNEGRNCDIRRFELSAAQQTLPTLDQQIRDAYGHTGRLRYVDDEGDWIDILSTLELNEAVRVIQSEGGADAELNIHVFTPFIMTRESAAIDCTWEEIVKSDCKAETPQSSIAIADVEEDCIGKVVEEEEEEEEEEWQLSLQKLHELSEQTRRATLESCADTRRMIMAL